MVFGTFHLMKEGVYNYSCQFIVYVQSCFYRGGWDTEGVSVINISNGTNSSIITCNSTHLTSFAVLVDVSGGHEVTMLSY